MHYFLAGMFAVRKKSHRTAPQLLSPHTAPHRTADIFKNRALHRTAPQTFSKIAHRTAPHCRKKFSNS